MRLFAATFKITSETSVLDVGGAASLWRLLPVTPRVTMLNMPRANPNPEEMDLVFGDGCALPFADQCFDIVFSNSVIEHVGNRGQQKKFADEIRRVGRSYFVQTPNRWFPVEPHLLTPMVHWLPRGLQRAIVPRFTLWQWLERPSEDRRRFYVEHYLRDIRLLSGTQMMALFPGATILEERWLGLTKSVIVVKKVST